MNRIIRHRVDDGVRFGNNGASVDVIVRGLDRNQGWAQLEVRTKEASGFVTIDSYAGHVQLTSDLAVMLRRGKNHGDTVRIEYSSSHRVPIEPLTYLPLDQYS